MELPINKAIPLIMHVDLNSCFATIEQQANILLRGKPIAVAAYATERGCILAPSIEAKRYGIKTGMRVFEGKKLYPDLIVVAPDSAKYRDVHQRFKKIFQDFSPDVFPKSIDEAVIDFSRVAHLYPDIKAIGYEIKKRMKKEIGEWIVCSIGIAQNRALAKFAAGLDKPDGLLVIDHNNITTVLKRARILDFPGINIRYEARLRRYGIRTPIEFFNASCQTLEKQVFKSIVGRYWYQRLRGYEVDSVEWSTKTIGQQYALKKKTDSNFELSRLLTKLCEKMGRRLRYANYFAHGIHVACRFEDGTYWHHGQKVYEELFTTSELYKAAWSVLAHRPPKIVTLLSVHAFDLTSTGISQIGLFDEYKIRHRKVSLAVDSLNNMYGEFVITPAKMMKMDTIILDRIAFGRIKELENGFFTTD